MKRKNSSRILNKRVPLSLITLSDSSLFSSGSDGFSIVLLESSSSITGGTYSLYSDVVGAPYCPEDE